MSGTVGGRVPRGQGDPAPGPPGFRLLEQTGPLVPGLRLGGGAGAPWKLAHRNSGPAADCPTSGHSDISLLLLCCGGEVDNVQHEGLAETEVR